MQFSGNFEKSEFLSYLALIVLLESLHQTVALILATLICFIFCLTTVICFISFDYSNLFCFRLSHHWKVGSFSSTFSLFRFISKLFKGDVFSDPTL